jgi:hypothetical protein
MADTLLTYAVSSNPDPIQASQQTGSPSLAILTIIVSNDTHRLIECQSISFGFLKGTDAKDFFSDATGIGASVPTGWSLKQSGSLFTATPDKSPAPIGADGMVFVLSNIEVNQQVGTTDMTVTETTSGNTGTLAYPLSKFPQQFEVGELTADPPTINRGESTTLSWSGTGGATYELQYEDADGNTVTVTHVKDEPNQPLPANGNYTIDDLQQDTTFYLIVTLAVPGQEQPLKAIRFFPVIVTQPPPSICYFRPQGCTDKTCVIYASEFVLEWQIKYANEMQLTGTDSNGTHVINVAWGDTSTKITQTENETEYIMTIKNEAGEQQQSSVAVTLIPPVLVGTIVAFAGPVNTLSAGWLNCNGQEVSGNTYPQLLAQLPNTYGVPRTSGNVVMPDLLGIFLLVVDPTGVVDPDYTQRSSPISGNSTIVGQVIGSRQGQQLLNHTHHWDKNFSYIGDGGDDIQVQLWTGGGDQGTKPTTLNDGGGNETRPVNVYVYYLIYGGIPKAQEQQEAPK